jgi:hypothetical protein
MSSPTPDHWQIQDAMQRFSESGRLTRPALDLASILLGGPKLDAGNADVFAEIEAERKADLERAVDF